MSPIQIAVIIAAVLTIGLSKGGVGAALPISLVLPMLSLVFDPKDAVPLMVPFLIIADLFALRIYWGKWNLRVIRQTLPLAVVSVVVGGVLLSAIDATALKVVIAIFTLSIVGYRLLSDRLTNVTYGPRAWHGYLSGAAGGLASTLANAGGPIYVTYLLLQSLEPIPFIGTATLFFAVLNWLKLPVFWQQGLLDAQTILQYAWAIPLLPFGVWLGRRIVDRFDQKTFERLILVLLVISALLLLSTL